MARTVWCGATPGLLPLESALRKLPGIIAHLGFIPKSCQYVLLSRDGEKCAGEGFEPDRGVARRDPHEPIARGALSGHQSSDSLLLRGLRPLGRQHTTLPCHPLLREGDPLPHAPSPVGVQCTRHQENSAGPKPQTLPNFLGAGRAFLPLSKIVTARVGRRPPQPL